jgi:hypothetical protein
MPDKTPNPELSRPVEQAGTGRRLRIPRGFTASTFSLGLALQTIEKLIHHNVQHFIVATVDEDAEDSGDSEDPAVHFQRELKRIRRGEYVDRLTLRLK